MTERDITSIREFVKSHSIAAVAEKLLYELGFKCNLLGTMYLRDAIAMQYANGHCSLCKRIYPEIGKKYITTSERVERAIRHAINLCYAEGKPMEMTDLFGKSSLTGRYAPSSGEFISEICTWIRLEQAEDKRIA